MSRFSLVRSVANVLRPAVSSWRRFWDVDHRAVNFMTEDEYRRFCEDMEKLRERMEKEAAMDVARFTLRKKLDEAERTGTEEAQERSSSSQATAATEDKTSDGDGSDGSNGGPKHRFGGMDTTSVHILVGGGFFLPVFLYILACMWADGQVDKKGMAEARMANRMVLDKRLEAIEELLSGGATSLDGPGGSSSPLFAHLKGNDDAAQAQQQQQQQQQLQRRPPGSDDSFLSRLFGQPVGGAAVYDAFFNKTGIGEELERRKEAMIRAQQQQQQQRQQVAALVGSGATAPTVATDASAAAVVAPAPEWASRLEERLATIERQLRLSEEAKSEKKEKDARTTAIDSPSLLASPSSSFAAAPSSSSSSSSLRSLLESVDRLDEEWKQKQKTERQKTEGGAASAAGGIIGAGECPMGYGQQRK